MKSNKAFKDIEILKERQKLRILQQELKIKEEIKELGENLVRGRWKSTLEESLVSNSSLAFKLGYWAVQMISDRIRSRKRKRR